MKSQLKQRNRYEPAAGCKANKVMNNVNLFCSKYAALPFPMQPLCDE